MSRKLLVVNGVHVIEHFYGPDPLDAAPAGQRKLDLCPWEHEINRWLEDVDQRCVTKSDPSGPPLRLSQRQTSNILESRFTQFGGFFTYYHRINGKTVAFTSSDTDLTTWMGSDIVNSTAATRTLAGDVSTQRYTPFGETRTNGNLDTDRLYTGQIHDESSGLAFYNARYYDPTTKRFISPDSIVPNALDGQDYNRQTGEYLGSLTDPGLGRDR